MTGVSAAGWLAPVRVGGIGIGSGSGSGSG